MRYTTGNYEACAHPWRSKNASVLDRFYWLKLDDPNHSHIAPQ